MKRTLNRLAWLAIQSFSIFMLLLIYSNDTPYWSWVALAIAIVVGIDMAKDIALFLFPPKMDVDGDKMEISFFGKQYRYDLPSTDIKYFSTAGFRTLHLKGKKTLKLHDHRFDRNEMLKIIDHVVQRCYG